MIFVLMGPPGAGKGTQCDLLVEKQKYAKLATGDVLRKNIDQGTELGKYAKDIMANGLLLPDDVLLKLVKSGLKELASAKGIILDGYPRTTPQAQDLIDLVGKELKAVIHIDVPVDVLIARIAGRRVCGNCGASYHIAKRPPKKDGFCDKCLNKLVSRPDDEMEKIKVRVGVYKEQTEPVISFFKNLGLYHKIEGSGETDVVFRDVLNVINGSGVAQ